MAWGGEKHPDNPAGCGLPPVPGAGGAVGRLPNLFDPAEADAVNPSGGRAANFSARDPAWPARHAQGSFDDQWLAQRWPGEPEDADPRNHFLADADQRAPSFWAGGERVRLSGFDAANRTIEWTVPAFAVKALYKRVGDDALQVQSSVLDTLALFPDEQVAVLVYRACVPQCGVDGRSVAMVMVAAEDAGEQRPVSYYEAHLRLRDSPAEPPSVTRLSDALMPGAEQTQEALAPEVQLPQAEHSGPADAGTVAEPEPQAAAEQAPPDPANEPSVDAPSTPTFEAVAEQHLAATGSAIDRLIAQLRTTGANVGTSVAAAASEMLPAGMAGSLDETLAQMQLMQGSPDAAGLNAALATQLEKVKQGLADMQQNLPAVEAAARQLPPALQALGSSSSSALNLSEVMALQANPGALLQAMAGDSGPSAAGSAARGWASMQAEADAASGARQTEVDALMQGADPASILRAFMGEPGPAGYAPAAGAADAAHKLNALAQAQMPAWAAEQLAAPNAGGIGSAMDALNDSSALRDAVQSAASPEELLQQAQQAVAAMVAESSQAPGEPGALIDEGSEPQAAVALEAVDPAGAMPPLVGDLAYARRHAVDAALAGHSVTDEEALALGRRLIAAVRQGESLAGRDFAGADLRGADLRGAVLTGVFLECARLQGACLADARAENAVLVEACLDNADCGGAQFTAANLNAAQARDSAWTGADLTDGTMVGARFDRARAIGAVMVRSVATASHWQGANLDASRMDDARFDSVDFRRASWRSVQWSGVDAQNSQVDEVDATRAQLSACRFVGVTGTAWRLEDARIEGSAFLDARLPGLKGARLAARDTSWHAAVLDGADFEQADLENAYMTEVQLADASLVRADLRNALLNGATLCGSSFAQAQLLGANLRCVDASRGDFREAQLRKSDFTGAQLDFADMTGADLPAGPLTLPSHV